MLFLLVLAPAARFGSVLVTGLRCYGMVHVTSGWFCGWRTSFVRQCRDCMYTLGCIRPGVRLYFERCFKDIRLLALPSSPFPFTSRSPAKSSSGFRSPLLLPLIIIFPHTAHLRDSFLLLSCCVQTRSLVTASGILRSVAMAAPLRYLLFDVFYASDSVQTPTAGLLDRQSFFNTIPMSDFLTLFITTHSLLQFYYSRKSVAA
ncbi:hypothetical protein BDW69DRAFT_57891 [Aspergillus filifer]